MGGKGFLEASVLQRDKNLSKGRQTDRWSISGYKRSRVIRRNMELVKA